MANVTFYVLKTLSSCTDTEIVEDKVCGLVSKYWRKGYKILISCEDERQAVRLDNMLWQNPKTFIPHSIVSRLYHCITPGELTLIQVHQSSSYSLLMHLKFKSEKSACDFHEVIDFVPSDESLKKIARKRYKNYRKLGCSLNTITLSKMV
jgi:DNA polymerase-3 subunit chi